MNVKSAFFAGKNIMGVWLGGRIPLRVTHCITYRCNLDCRYCERHAGGSEMTTSQIKTLIGSFAAAGCASWSFNGGEALLRDDLGELIAHAKSKGMHVSLATNGTMVAEKIGMLKDADVVSVSVDGPKDVNDSIRCGSFERMRQGLEALSKAGIKTMFTTVVASHNIHRLGEVLDLAEEFGARAFFQPVRVQKEDLNGKSRMFFPTKEEMGKAMEYLKTAKASGRPVASSGAYLDAISRSWPDSMPKVRCFAGRAFCFITPEGFVTGCCDTLTCAKGPASFGAGDFKAVPTYACDTCYSSMPLEMNLLMDRLPWSLMNMAKNL